MMTRGVTPEITDETLSTSSRPVAMTSAAMTPAPAHAGMPYCCRRIEPAPANMTKPANRVSVTEMSRKRDTTGCATFRNTV